MIYNEMREVIVYPITLEKNEYGELKRGEADYIRMTLKDYRHSDSNDLRYQNVELIGITQSRLSEKWEVEVDGVRYKVVKTLPSRRHTVCYLEK